MCFCLVKSFDDILFLQLETELGSHGSSEEKDKTEEREDDFAVNLQNRRVQKHGQRERQTDRGFSTQGDFPASPSAVVPSNPSSSVHFKSMWK